MIRKSLYFTAPRKVELQEEEIPEPSVGEVRVGAVCSAISAGTEILLYNGEAPGGLAADSTLSALSGSLAFPLKYGYCMVGRVDALGPGVDPVWLGKLVFAFNPHESAFVMAAEELIPVAEGCTPEDAAFLPAVETAVNLILDGNPRLGERVAVLGQGLIGLLTTAILAKHPLDRLFSMDSYPARRELSLGMGALASLEPAAVVEGQKALGPIGADLVYELSGNPETLNLAMQLVGDNGRIVVGSWYGKRRASVDLGGRFHRGRVKIISSQVSHMEPALLGRWDRQRRFEQAWKYVLAIKPGRLVSQRVPFDRAPEAYALLDQQPEQTLAILLMYEA